MSRTLLAIISSRQDNELVRRHWPYFKLTGWDILGVGTEDKLCEWPEQILTLNTGKLGLRKTPAGTSIWGLVYQELDVWTWFMAHEHLYDSVCVVEADTLFIRKPPQNHPGGPYLACLVPNFSRPGLFKTSCYMQTPRWSDRPTTEKLLNYGSKMLTEGDAEFWVSDRFPAWICYRYHIPFMGFPSWTRFAFSDWSDMDEESCMLRDIRVAVKCGCIALHGIKTEAHLKAAQEALKECQE
jgi:hypothetical protein